MKYFLLLVSALLLQREITFSQISDSLIFSRKINYLKTILETKEYLYPIRSKEASVFLDIPIGVYPEKEQILYKTPDGIFIRFDGTGFIFKLVGLNDSLASFKRIDKTVNINYNLGAFNFISGKDIYNYGGYGFWKSSGLIRKYDEKSREWSIIKTNIEVPQQIFKIITAWFDSEKNHLYVPYRSEVNAGLKENIYQYGKITPLAYQFDLNTRDWKLLGESSKQSIDILKDANLFLSTKKGLMVLAFEQLYLFDYVNNKILKLNDNLIGQLYMRITDVNAVYHLNKQLYLIDRQKGTVDSLQLDLDTFQYTGEPIYTPIKDYRWIWMLSGAIAIMLIVALVKRWFDKKIASIKPANQHTKNFKFEFSDIEKALIQMLLEKSKSNQTATINEINYVLGVKDKNIGLQKKVRSEVFNAVNEKFKLISDWDEPLVQSIRSESDKRYFEYMIRKDMIKEAEKVMQS
jgi:hypothetical protein